ncbi:MAG: DNA mismatch endonuclease Vsr [Planctomycetales bacterium]|nr:DNA mismatch endonuclease Vsr [Planctomycetales bacterium]
MSNVRGKDTRPEIAIRSLIHSLGYRYRLHDKSLPGCPDLVFSARRCVILVHGCFWHQHTCAAGNRRPKSRQVFWNAKLESNVTRDRRHLRKLRRLGWRVLVIWECQVKPKNLLKIEKTIRRFLR